uniref:HD domain-containing protein n=1 Tax=viral metagenome TaxID=1070528 RepID=A0A6C0I493_9ZZZZ
MTFLNKLFHFVLLTTQKHNIDESHGVSHSMNVLRFANEIYEDEVEKYPILQQQEKVIYIAATLHDMCDKKYMNQDDGIDEIGKFLNKDISVSDMNVVKLIISTMSYSYVKTNGFPIMGPYKKAYDIVREADLLSAYDFDRCMIYNMHKKDGDLSAAFEDASSLFENRVFKHNDDGLFTTEYSRKKSLDLESRSLQQIDTWKRLIKKPSLTL